jgi:hypothetical protein
MLSYISDKEGRESEAHQMLVDLALEEGISAPTTGSVSDIHYQQYYSMHAITIIDAA